MRDLNLLVCLYYPFFDEHLGGGVQCQVRILIEELARHGLKITVLCPDTPGFEYPTLKNVTVLPILRDVDGFLLEKLPYDNVNHLETALEQNSIIWSVDRHFPIRTEKPIVLSLNAVCYETERNALLGLNWEVLVVPSAYALNVVNGEVLKDGVLKTVLSAPVDPQFTPTNRRSRISTLIPVEDTLKYLLFPHRPDSKKGHVLALGVLRKLIEQDASYRLLIPRPPLALTKNIAPESAFIDDFVKVVSEYGLDKFVIFHEWIDYAVLPEYYSLGFCTLMPSQLPETFGLSLIQSIACGTPVISSGQGSLSDTVPEGMGHLISNDFNCDDVANMILSLKGDSGLHDGQTFIDEHYSLDRIVKGYIEVFMDLHTASKENGRKAV